MSSIPQFPLRFSALSASSYVAPQRKTTGGPVYQNVCPRHCCVFDTRCVSVPLKNRLVPNSSLNFLVHVFRTIQVSDDAASSCSTGRTAHPGCVDFLIYGFAGPPIGKNIDIRCCVHNGEGCLRKRRCNRRIRGKIFRERRKEHCRESKRYDP